MWILIEIWRTKGSDVVSKTDFKIPFSTSLKIFINSSSFVSFLDKNLKSTSETFDVGTLIALHQFYL